MEHKKARYIVGVSGGSDSMALLHLLNRFHFDVVVAHVNYKKRESADFDQSLVASFCKEKGIIFEALELNEIKKGNFQARAREIRYDFFRELVNQYEADGVVVAHHFDDLLETYLLQKKSKKIPMYWGLKNKVMIDGLTIIRPLLDFSKKDILEYIDMNHIVYGEDESNHLGIYERNRIRKEILFAMSEQEKEALLQEIEGKNKELKKFHKEVQKLLKEGFDPFNQAVYQICKVEIRVEALRQWLLVNGVNSRRFSLRYLKELDGLLLGEKNSQYSFGDKRLYFNYGALSIVDAEEEYQYKLSKIEEMKTAYFTVSIEGESLSAVTVDNSDFPLIIRSWRAGDKIELRYGHKKISRFFIERKIPTEKRKVWPVIENRMGDIILVPGIGCDVKHYSNNPNMFVVK